jgi:heptosyltransferase II
MRPNLAPHATGLQRRDETARRSILLINYGGIGDVIRSLSTVRLIKARYPDRPIDIVCRTPVHLLMPFVPEIRRAYGDPTGHLRLGLRYKFDLLRKLRNGDYVRSYVFGVSYKKALIPFLAGIPERVGFLGEFRFIVVNRIWRQPVASRTLRDCTLSLENGERLPATIPLPRLVVADEALARWREREKIADDSIPVLAMAPGVNRTYGHWPIENYVEIARRAYHRGWAVWVLGAPAERHYAEAIAAAVPIRDFTPPPLDDVVYQIKAATVFLGNESGLLHVSSALGAVSVGVFGPTLPYYDGPIDRAVIAVEPLPGPDGKVKLDRSGERPVAAVTVEQVEAALVDAMQRAQAQKRMQAGRATV